MADAPMTPQQAEQKNYADKALFMSKYTKSPSNKESEEIKQGFTSQTEQSDAVDSSLYGVDKTVDSLSLNAGWMDAITIAGSGRSASSDGSNMYDKMANYRKQVLMTIVPQLSNMKITSQTDTGHYKKSSETGAEQVDFALKKANSINVGGGDKVQLGTRKYLAADGKESTFDIDRNTGVLKQGGHIRLDSAPDWGSASQVMNDMQQRFTKGNLKDKGYDVKLSANGKSVVVTRKGKQIADILDLNGKPSAKFSAGITTEELQIMGGNEFGGG